MSMHHCIENMSNIIFQGLNTCIQYVTANSSYTNTTHTQTQHTRRNTHVCTHACIQHMYATHARTHTCTHERTHTHPLESYMQWQPKFSKIYTVFAKCIVYRFLAWKSHLNVYILTVRQYWLKPFYKTALILRNYKFNRIFYWLTEWVTSIMPLDKHNPRLHD